MSINTIILKYINRTIKGYAGIILFRKNPIYYMKILIFITLHLLPLKLLSQSERPAYDFLDVYPSAKASSLAGAYDTYTDDPDALFYNPASISTVTGRRISAGFGKYLMDINFGTLSYAQKYKDLGWFGIGIKYFNYGTFEKTDYNLQPSGENFTANDLMFSFGYGNYIYEKINYGINLKFIYSSISDYKSSALAADASILYLIPSEQIGVSISVNNLGFQLSKYGETKEKLPLDVRLGFSKKLEHTPVRINATLSKINLEREKFIQRFRNFSLGIEIIFSDNVTARLGYDNDKRQSMKLGSTLGLAGFSTGLGIKFAGRYLFDYSLNSFGKIGTTHRINLGYIFSK